MRQQWELRAFKTPEDHAIYAAITPINWDRTGLADYWSDEGEGQPRPAPWDTLTFDHPDVMTAYLNYCREVIATFEPDYLAIGIEVNLLMKQAPDLWPAYLELHKVTYAALKAEYPDLPVFVSVTAPDLLGVTDADPEEQAQALADILPVTDILGLSVYPYMSAFMTGPLPESFFDSLAELTEKPIAITETGYPAETLVLADFSMDSDAEKQADYIDRLLETAARDQYVFVINFVIRDYDALWEKIAGGLIESVWRDTGLYDENGNMRPALEVWRRWLNVSYLSPAP